jgi:hypothetical protein
MKYCKKTNTVQLWEILVHVNRTKNKKRGYNITANAVLKCVSSRTCSIKKRDTRWLKEAKVKFA